MHEAARVRERAPARRSARRRRAARSASRTSPRCVAEGRAPDQLHDVEQPAVGERARRRGSARCPGCSRRASTRASIVERAGDGGVSEAVRDLDRDLAVEQLVERAVHRAHAAAADLFDGRCSAALRIRPGGGRPKPSDRGIREDRSLRPPRRTSPARRAGTRRRWRRARAARPSACSRNRRRASASALVTCAVGQAELRRERGVAVTSRGVRSYRSNSVKGTDALPARVELIPDGVRRRARTARGRTPGGRARPGRAGAEASRATAVPLRTVEVERDQLDAAAALRRGRRLAGDAARSDRHTGGRSAEARLRRLEALEPGLLERVGEERLGRVLGILRVEPPGQSEVRVDRLPVAVERGRRTPAGARCVATCPHAFDD